MKPLVTKNLKWSYGDHKILKNIDLSLEAGKLTGIIGPNGSGKTTFVKLITKLLPAETKSVYINDVDIDDMKVKHMAKFMSLMPQTNETIYDLTVHEVVMLGRTPHIKRFESEKQQDLDLVKEAMLDTDTWQYKDRYINQLSGGERQRVFIAKALAQEPQILILDEPVTYLDVHHQFQVMELIKKLSVTRKITIITILHDLNFAMKYCDYVILFNQGQVYQYGRPERVINKENIKAVYNLDVHVIEHPKTQTPHILF